MDDFLLLPEDDVSVAQELLPGLHVTTDQTDYAPGETVVIKASGYSPGSTITFNIADDPVAPGDDNETDIYSPFTATDGGIGDLDGIANGQIVTTWIVPADNNGTGSGTPDALNATLNLNATGNGADGLWGTEDDQIATTTFTDGNPSLTLNQWETKTDQWAGGQANANQATYLEGDVVPFSLEASNLTVGTTYGVRINLDTYQSNTDAGGFLYLDTYSKSIAPIPDNFSHAASLASPTPDSNFTFTDPSYTNPGLQFYVANANVLSVTYRLSPDGLRRYADVTFQAIAPNENDGEATAEIYWGQRLALPNEVVTTANTGGSSGASGFTGGSLQTKIEGTGTTGINWITPSNAVQIMPGVVQQGSISGYKWNDLDGQGDRDAGEPGLAGWTISLYKDNGNHVFDSSDALITTQVTSNGSTDANGDGVINNGDLGFYKFTPVLRGTYFVTETQKSGWTQTYPSNDFWGPLTINENTPKHTNINFGNYLNNPNFTIAKDVTSVTGGVGLSANSAGDIIHYTIVLTNTGNQALTGVTLTDPFAAPLSTVTESISNNNRLDVGETWTYTAAHTVTQAEIDAGQILVNVATADTDQTTPKSDDATTPVIQNPSLNIIKNATVPGGTADAAGELISYTIRVANTGNQTLTGVTVTDSFVSNLNRGQDSTGDNDNQLEVDEVWSYTASHIVTQAEIDAGGNIVNTATADSNQTGPDTDNASIPVQQKPSLNITKNATVPGGTANVAGEVITYTISLQNTGNQTLTGVTVTDPSVNNLSRGQDSTGDNDNLLEVGETWSYTATHTVTQAEIDAGNDIVNIVTADSNQTGPDTDNAIVDVVQTPAIDVEKLVSVDGGATFVDADTAPGPNLNRGTNPVFKFIVTNTGNVTLSNITLSDSDFDLNGASAGSAITINSLAANNNAPGGADEFTFTFTGATWQGGQHTNTATVSATFKGQTLTDTDNANYFGRIPPPGVRTPGFWRAPNWLSIWDGNQNNNPKQVGADPAFPISDILLPANGYYPGKNGTGAVVDPVTGATISPDSSNAAYGILVGDWNRNGQTDNGERTIFYTLTEARTILDASQHVPQDKRYTLDRSLVASWLNFLAFNPAPTNDINNGIAWIQAHTPDENGDGIGDGKLTSGTSVRASDPAWSASSGIHNGLPTGSVINMVLDNYNNGLLSA
ncbi:DUF11 domain-containing protein [Leptolyngbya sp. FACHB-16]|uniref:DUF7507 domain-containing protein n=1 Tax=unclassified Leptolyngbya TaxID=2650499 RepID=UPI001687587D|nr:DUF11 domain-containing protein [Leptolyngbya sp. FACHB-16]MBD2158600.1 DUF11 domain-containing protein [Leptolyngbya sp. FACHB-16]